MRNGVEVRGVSSGCDLEGAAFDFNSGEAFGPDGEFLHLHVYLGVGGDFRFICSGAALTVDELHEAEVPHTHKADPDDPKSADVPCRPEGVQFVVYGGDCLVWLDLDDVRNPDTGEVEGWAEQIVNDLGGYWEVSASGCGLHGCVRGKLPRTENHQVKDDPLERTGRAKQPYCFEVNEGELFAFAGIWDQWKNGGRQDSRTLLDFDYYAECRHLVRA